MNGENIMWTRDLVSDESFMKAGNDNVLKSVWYKSGGRKGGGAKSKISDKIAHTMFLFLHAINQLIINKIEEGTMPFSPHPPASSHDYTMYYLTSRETKIIILENIIYYYSWRYILRNIENQVIIHHYTRYLLRIRIKKKIYYFWFLFCVCVHVFSVHVLKYFDWDKKIFFLTQIVNYNL